MNGSPFRNGVLQTVDFYRKSLKWYVNKGIEFIDLHSIFKDNLVFSSIPNYFNNSETPIICYKYNKPIMSSRLYLTLIKL